MCVCVCVCIYIVLSRCCIWALSIVKDMNVSIINAG